MTAVRFGFNIDEVVDDSTRAQINTLKQWSSGENLPDLTNEQILHFLLRCDRDLPEAKSIIKKYYNLKAKAPSVFTERQIQSGLKRYLEQTEICVMPERTEDGCPIMFVRLIDTSYRNFNIDNYFKLLFMTVDSLLYGGPLPGLIVIFDLNGMSLMHLTKLKLGVLTTSILYFQDCLPVKLNAVHCINTVSFIETVMKLVRPIANAEALQKLHFHPRSMDFGTFHSNHLEKKYLPEELGGQLPSTRVLHQKHIQTLTDLEDHFIAEEMQRKQR